MILVIASGTKALIIDRNVTEHMTIPDKIHLRSILFLSSAEFRMDMPQRHKLVFHN